MSKLIIYHTQKSLSKIKKSSIRDKDVKFIPLGCHVHENSELLFKSDYVVAHHLSVSTGLDLKGLGVDEIIFEGCESDYEKLGGFLNDSIDQLMSKSSCLIEERRVPFSFKSF